MSVKLSFLKVTYQYKKEFAIQHFYNSFDSCKEWFSPLVPACIRVESFRATHCPHCLQERSETLSWNQIPNAINNKSNSFSGFIHPHITNLNNTLFCFYSKIIVYLVLLTSKTYGLIKKKKKKASFKNMKKSTILGEKNSYRKNRGFFTINIWHLALLTLKHIFCCQDVHPIVNISITYLPSWKMVATGGKIQNWDVYPWKNLTSSALKHTKIITFSV